MESLIVVIILILIVMGLFLWAAEKLPVKPLIVQLIQGLIIVLAALAIARRAGLL